MAEGVVRREEATVEIVTGGEMIDALAGLAVVALAILGLAGLAPQWLASVAMIAVGVALVSLGMATVARYAGVATEPGAGTELGGGVGVELLGGVVAIVLGLLALLDVSRLNVLGAAIIVVGGALLLGGSVLRRLDVATVSTARGQRAMREAILATAAVQALVGISGVALGILALTTATNPEVLILVALLAYGGAILLSSVGVTGRVLSLVR
jgi:hypothetical protein